MSAKERRKPLSDEEYAKRIEDAFLTHMAENDGDMPTVETVRKWAPSSNSRLCPAVRAVRSRLMAVQTKLNAMPDIPQELSLAHEQALKEVWARAREYQSAEISDLKRGQAAKDDLHRIEIDEMQKVVEIVEESEKATQHALEVVEASLLQVSEELVETAQKLAATHARLEERDAILEMLASKLQSVDPETAPKKKALARAKLLQRWPTNRWKPMICSAS